MTGNPEILRWTIGDVTVLRVEESVMPVPWEKLVPAGATQIEGCRPWIDPFISSDGGDLLLSMHSFVVQTPDTLIVVDTCVGASDDYTLPGDPGFGERLAGALPGGLDSVDVVVCTHLHFDHIGWNTTDGPNGLVPRFPGARYLITSDELAAPRDEEDQHAFDASVEPLVRAGCLDSVRMDHRIDSWVALEPSPGHTPGHVSLRITSGTATALITGDIIHTPLQFAHPESSSTSDADPALATATRQRYVHELADSDVLILGTHFPPPTSGQLRTVGGDIRFG